MLKLPKIIYTLLIATFLERFSYFLIIPFLSIYLSKNYDYSGFQIGFVISLFAITALFMSFVAAPFIDKLNKKILIYGGLLLTAISFLFFPLINTYSGFLIFSIVNSIGNSFLSPTYKAMIAIFVEENYKQLVFNVRYYLINISATLAPLLSTQLQRFGVKNICYIIVFAYCINLAIFTYSFVKGKYDFNPKISKAKISLRETFNILSMNKAFMYLILGQILFVFGYNIMTSILPQYFAINHSQIDASKLFAFLLAVNGVTVITCQLFVYKFSQIVSIKTCIIIGAFMMPLGLFFIGVLENTLLQSVSMVVFTLGEMSVFTMIDIRIDEISSVTHKGSYYSLAGLQNIGALSAPLIGGVLIDNITKGVLLFGILSLISLCSIIFFRRSNSQSLEV